VSVIVSQFVNLLAAVLLMLAFAMISQRRILSLIQLFTMQGIVLVLAELLGGLQFFAGELVMASEKIARCSGQRIRFPWTN